MTVWIKIINLPVCRMARERSNAKSLNQHLFVLAKTILTAGWLSKYSCLVKKLNPPVPHIHKPKSTLSASKWSHPPDQSVCPPKKQHWRTPAIMAVTCITDYRPVFISDGVKSVFQVTDTWPISDIYRPFTDQYTVSGKVDVMMMNTKITKITENFL